MSAKKTVRHIQNNFRLTTKLLSDSNILPVSKVLLKNNFPTYELPLHNPNSRPKKKKTNIDCPPCPPAKDTDCPEPEKYSGQTSYLHPRSKYYPRSKWEPKEDYKSKLTDADKEYLTHDLSKDEDALRRAEFLMEFGGEEALEEDDEIKARINSLDSQRLKKAKDVSNLEKHKISKPNNLQDQYDRVRMLQNKYTKEGKSIHQRMLSDLILVTEYYKILDEVEFGKKPLNILLEVVRDIEQAEIKVDWLDAILFRVQHIVKNQKIDRQESIDSSEIFGNSSLDESDFVDDDGDYWQHRSNNDSRSANSIKLKNHSEYKSACEYTDKKSLFSQMEKQFKEKDFDKEKFEYNSIADLRFGDYKSKNETIYNRHLDGYELVTEYMEKPNLFYELYSNCINFIIEKIEDQKSEGLTYPLNIEKYFVIENKKTEKNYPTELEIVASKVYDKVVKDKYGIKGKVSPVEFDTIEFSDLLRKKLISSGYKIVNKEVNNLFEITYNLKSEKFLKEIQESFELALVKYCRQIFFEKIIDLKYEKRKEVANELHKKIFDRILETYNNQPVLNVRTSTSVQNQAYSTPIPLGFLISFYLGLYEQQNRSVYEPCAGNGSLLIAAHLDNVTANELDPIRIRHLESHGFKVEPGNALDYIPNRKFARIVMNPPFGVYPANKHIKINGRAITQIDQAIAINSLQYLEPNGIAAIILGGHTLTKDKFGGYKSTDQFFHNHLYRNYDVLKCIDINGDIYRKQGTSFDIRLIILRNSNTPEYRHILPYEYGNKPGQILKANTWEDLYEFLKEQYSEIKKGNESSDKNKINSIIKDFQEKKEEPRKESFYFGDVVSYENEEFAYVMDLTDFDSDYHYESLIVSKSKGFNHYDFIKIHRTRAKLVYKHSKLSSVFLNKYKELNELYLVHKYSETVFHVGDMIEYYFDLESAWGFVYQSNYDENRKENFELITRHGGIFEKVTRYDRPNKIKDITSLSKSEKEVYLEGLKAFSEYDKNIINKSATKHEDEKIISSINDIPKLVRQFMPLHQQKAVASFKSNEHVKVLDDLEKQILNTPQTYETEDIDTPEKILHLHYFYGNSDWYISEKDSNEKQDQAFGFVILNGDIDNAEWGYISIEELKNTNKVELDFYWTPIKFKELNKTKGESNEQQNNQSYTSNSSEASGELDSQRQRERIQANERDFGDRRNQRQRIENNKNNDSKRDRRPDTQHETDGNRARRDDSNTERIGVPGGLDSSDTQDSVIDEEKFRKFAEFLKKVGL